MPTLPALHAAPLCRAFAPFVQPRSIKGMVIGNDLDALLSAMYLHTRFGWEVVGIYDYTQLWYDANIADFVANLCAGAYLAVDLDIAHPAIYNIGHHICTTEPHPRLAVHHRALNPNLVAGVSQRDFAQKYPLNTIQWLHWLLGDTPRTPELRLLAWLGDSAFINGQSHRFRANMQQWIHEVLSGSPLWLVEDFAQLDEIAFERSLHREILPYLHRSSLCLANGQVASRHTQLRGHQCQWHHPVEQAADLQRLWAILADLTALRLPALPTRWACLAGARHSAALATLIPSKFANFAAFTAQSGLFSYVLPSRAKVNYTLLPLSV